MRRDTRDWVSKAMRLLREPTIHFFVIAAIILLMQRVAVSDPRTIVITPALRADLLRRFQDQLSRKPSGAEVEAYLNSWKRDEALYREALRDGIDRDDPDIRNLLISKMRERAMLQSRIPEPSESDLNEYLAHHRDLFDAPLIYEHEYVAFPKNEPDAEQKRAKYQLELNAGATTASLRLRSVAANVSRDRIEQEFGPETAARICRLPIGQWVPLETGDRLLLVKMIRVQGGLPEPGVLHERLIGAWKASMQQQSIERASKAIMERYKFEEPSK